MDTSADQEAVCRGSGAQRSCNCEHAMDVRAVGWEGHRRQQGCACTRAGERLCCAACHRRFESCLAKAMTCSSTFVMAHMTRSARVGRWWRHWSGGWQAQD